MATAAHQVVLHYQHGSAWDETITTDLAAAMMRCWPTEPYEVEVGGEVIGTLTFTPATAASSVTRQQPRRAPPREAASAVTARSGPGTRSGRPGPSVSASA